VIFRRAKRFRPFGAGARGTIAAIVATFALVSLISAGLSIWTTSHSRNRAAVVEMAARQRTLAERYVADLLLVQRGAQADPVHVGSLIQQSAHALLDGGTAPAVEGDDDETLLHREANPVVRAQLVEEERLAADLAASGRAYLEGQPLSSVKLTAGEHLADASPIQRIRILAALTSNVSLNAARTIAAQDDQNISNLIMLQVSLGAIGLACSLLLAWALIFATRRQSAHFRSLVMASTDLVLVLDGSGCRHASASVTTMLARPETELLGKRIFDHVHPDDRPLLELACQGGGARTFVFRLRNALGRWRHLEAHQTDLRTDKHIRGVVLNARDITDRVKLEHELTLQAQRDTFGSQLGEALEMADEENATFRVVERAMVEISAEAPMELLLADASRAHLERVAKSPTADAPGCPVESPFACVAVRRANPVVFESSEALNACPKLRDRPGGPCSAVCVPISFMGRSLGVLHATGPEKEPLVAERVSQLTTLATQAAARIGTVRAFEKTQLQAATDALTGLINRRTLEMHLRTMIRQGARFAVAIGDLDHFKQLNDKHGHEAGDRSLRVFAQLLQQSLRDADLVARWGGEEFVVVLPGLDREQAVTALQRFREELAGAHSGGNPPFTASFGVTDSAAGETIEELLGLADSGLYLAKRAGRDRIMLGEPSSDAARVQTPDTERPSPAAWRSRPALQQVAGEDDPQLGGLELRY
jgi:diguanylate cyclase (GGDEF)-like protein/PAS domain S-box-containing protein